MVASFYECSSIETVEWLVLCSNSGEFDFKMFFLCKLYFLQFFFFYFVLIFSFQYRGKRASLDTQSSDQEELLMVADACSFTEYIKQTPFIQPEKSFPQLLYNLTYIINFKSQLYCQDF